MQIIRIGIAGYGIVGKKRKECIDQHDHLKVTAVCDKDFTDKDLREPGIKYFKSYQELLNEDIDALLVCMSNDIAAEVTIAGLKRNLHVFCEKPPGRNMEDIIAVRHEEKKHENLKLMYGFNHRYHDSIRDTLNMLQSKELGEIINIRGVYGKSNIVTFNQPDWRTKREFAGGGVLLDQGIHMVDLMRLFGGEFDEVLSFISNSHWGYDVEDNAYALMRSGSGIVAMLNSSATQWQHKFEMHINLTKGSIILEGILSGSKSYGAETLTIVYADPDNDKGEPREQITKYNYDFSWLREINVFASSILNDELIKNGSSLDALKTMELVYRIYTADKSWKDKYKICFPEVKK